MGSTRRRHYDVTNTVNISRPREVSSAVLALLRARYPDDDFGIVPRAFRLFERLYAGTLPGYLGCDTWYHDAQHSLDCALATARLIDGHERSVPHAECLGPHRALLGIVIALFHDAGYIRRRGETAHNGAEYTLSHVHRSGEFLRECLPSLGLGADVLRATQLVHFTGYEIALDAIRLRDRRDRRLGALLGTADILAQSADCCYLEKCRDFLFREFAICGLAGTRRKGGPKPLYRSPDELLKKTVAYHRQLRRERLDGYFEHAYRYMDAHFGGHNPYLVAIAAHLQRVARLSRSHRLAELRQRPIAINRARLRAA